MFSIRLARSIFKKAFEKDQGFRIAYQSNVAAVLMDRYGMDDHEERNRAANDIMKVIFEAEKPVKGKIVGDIFKTNRFELMEIE